MIKSFEHKGLERFFTKGTKSGIQASHAVKLRDQLTFLNTAMTIDDMDIPGWRLHPLKGRNKTNVAAVSSDRLAVIPVDHLDRSHIVHTLNL